MAVLVSPPSSLSSCGMKASPLWVLQLNTLINFGPITTQDFGIYILSLSHTYTHKFIKTCIYTVLISCSGVMDEYQKEMKQLSVRLLRLILSSLGLAREDLTKWVGPAGEFTQGATTALQLNSYPACPDPNRTMGLAAHTDTSMFTILYQSNTSGLQIFRDGFGWVSVPPLAGALIVNVGDLLQILSNARFPAVLHRAVVNRTNQRLSIAYFYGPSTETRIMPLSKLIGPGDPPLYRSLTWKEYIGIKAKHLYRALSLVRLQQLAPMNGSLDMNDQ
uniref:Fe2OG dioxygenase domain-containing protein n=1 Tax=Nelumbo nucifera TaxID=4432 RepID=A0A822ZF18_NELNU|nr:TPA_asm: hypothetical protein HUJ06_003024 [Nelumbo nucifera]